MQAYETSMKAGDTRMLLSPNSEFFRYFNEAGGAPPRAGSAAQTPAAPAAPKAVPEASTPAPEVEPRADLGDTGSLPGEPPPPEPQ